MNGYGVVLILTALGLASRSAFCYKSLNSLDLDCSELMGMKLQGLCKSEN